MPSGIDSKLQQMTLSTRRELPRRSPAGTKGTKLMVTTNHFRIRLMSGAPEKIYIWNVTITRKAAGDRTTVSAGRVTRRVLELLLSQQQFATCYSDYNACLISFKDLTPSPAYFDVEYFEPEESSAPNSNRAIYSIALSAAVRPLETAPLKAFIDDPTLVLPRADEYETVLNIMLLRYAGQHNELTTAARGTKVFSLRNDNTRHDLGNGLWAYRGYVRRIKALQGGLLLCLNTTAAVMYEETWIDLLAQSWQPAGPGDQLVNFLEGLRVQGIFGQVHHIKPIQSIAYDRGRLLDPSQVLFKCEKHPQTGAPMADPISVQQYFKLAYPDLTPHPNSRVGLNIVLNVAAKGQRPIWWPACFCRSLPGQPYKHALPFPKQSQQMIKSACRDPTANISFITGEGLSMLGISRPNAQVNVGNVTAAPLQVKMVMDTIPARRIKPPSVMFLDNVMNTDEAEKGQWNLRNRKFKKAGPLCKYGILVLKKHPSEGSISNIREFERMLQTEIARYFNYSTAQTASRGTTELVYPPENQVARLKDMFKRCLSSGLEYLFIIPSDSSWYGDIKIAADSAGLHTTISLRKEDNTVKAKAGEIANILLKFNLKMGGSCWELKASEFPILQNTNLVMFVGIDVVHAPPGAMKDAPSVAAVVASVTPGINQQFPGIICLQHHPDPAKRSIEMIPNLSSMFASRLQLWAKRNGGDLPKLIFVYRDGVSDTQLDHVLDNEVPLMETACKMVYGQFNRALPSIFVQSTQKRHITRFYAPKEAGILNFDPRRNSCPGLVVDTHVVHRTLSDWFAVSHKCIQGTSRPAHHYPIFSNGINMNMDDLQQLTNALAYNYGRSVTSISVPGKSCNSGPCLVHLRDY